VVDPSLNFANNLYNSIQENIDEWAVGEGSFVVVALLEALSGKEREEMISQLKKSKHTILRHVDDNKGVKIVLEKIS